MLVLCFGVFFSGRSSSDPAVTRGYDALKKSEFFQHAMEVTYEDGERIVRPQQVPITVTDTMAYEDEDAYAVEPSTLSAREDTER